jgi:hypothetical protein
MIGSGGFSTISRPTELDVETKLNAFKLALALAVASTVPREFSP